jgi:hypothetical protein
MYQEIFLILIIITVIYFMVLNDSRIEWEAFNGVKYKIKNDNKELNQIKADFLARIDIKARKIVKHMNDNNLPTKEIASRTHNRFKNSNIGETPQGEKSGAAFTINKGDIYICCITKGKLNDENDTFFVCLHELAHVMSNSYGHGEEFKTNFNFIVKLAVKLGLWKDPKYEEKPVDYCGVQVTTSPCSGDLCNKNSLDYYFKESLLDYK